MFRLVKSAEIVQKRVICVQYRIKCAKKMIKIFLSQICFIYLHLKRTSNFNLYLSFSKVFYREPACEGRFLIFFVILSGFFVLKMC